MSGARSPRPITRRTRAIWLTVVATGVTLGAVLSTPLPTNAAEAAVGLGTAAEYSVLGGETVTNTGPTTLNRDVGVSPGTAIVGFPPGLTAGAKHEADAHAAQAQAALGIAYDDAASRAPTATVSGDMVGMTLPGGVYKSTSTLAVSGVLTLDAQGDPDAVFIFQIASSLGTASSSSISLVNGAQACNVFWQVGSEATLGTNSTFVGTIMASASISVTTGTSVAGRALARSGQVSLDDNVFTTASCAATTTTEAGGVTTVPSTTETTATQVTGPSTTETPTTVVGAATTIAGATTTVAGATTTTDVTVGGAGTTTTTDATVGGASATTTTAAPLASGLVPTSPGLSVPVVQTAQDTFTGLPAAPGVPTAVPPLGSTTPLPELPRTGPGQWLALVSVLGVLLIVLGRLLVGVRADQVQ